MDADVLVVGSGPVGLTLTCELLRRGIAVRTVERVAERERESKGIWVMPRTLEIFDSLGIADRLVDRGHRLTGNVIYTGGRRVASVGYGRIGPTRYPFALVVPQWEVEDALNEVVVERGGRVEPETTLTAIDQDADGVTATLESAGGVEHARVAWLVGCDGRTSTVRDLLGIGFEAEPYATTLLLADAVLEGPHLRRDTSHTFQGPAGAFIAVPLPGGLTRAVVYGPPSEGHVEPTIGAIETLMHRYGPAELSLRDARWLSAFRIQRSMADRLRVGRCLLAGDAAHVHSPFGGQGMNTGIQDATNLGWKLAAALGGPVPSRLLESYQVERRGVAERVLADTHRQTKAFLGVSGPRAAARDVVLRTMAAAGVLDRRIGTSLAGYFDSYRTSPLTHRHDGGPSPRPGDRVPDVTLPAAVGPGARPGAARSLHAELAVRTLTALLVVDPARPADVLALDGLAGRLVADGAAPVTIVLGRRRLGGANHLASGRVVADPDRELASVLGAPRGGALLVRPDGHLVCRTRPGEAEHLLEHVVALSRSTVGSGAPAGRR